KSGSIAKKPRLHLFRRIHVLPSHRHTELKHAHEFLWQRKMSRKEHTYMSIACGRENFENLPRYLIGILNLAQNSNLHIVNEQSDPLWITHLFQRLRYAEPICAFHIHPKLALAVGSILIDQ